MIIKHETGLHCYNERDGRSMFWWPVATGHCQHAWVAAVSMQVLVFHCF